MSIADRNTARATAIGAALADILPSTLQNTINAYAAGIACHPLIHHMGIWVYITNRWLVDA